MRDITGEAKVNLSIAYYYFRNKEDLLLGVIEKYLLPVLEREREALAAARAEAGEGRAISPRRLLEAVVFPRMKEASDAARSLRLLLEMHSDAVGRSVAARLDKLTKETQVVFFAEFQRTFPHLSPCELRFRMTNMHTLFTGWKFLSPILKAKEAKGALYEAVPRATYVEMFLELLERMFSAPPSLPPPIRRRRENAPRNARDSGGNAPHFSRKEKRFHS